MQTALTFPPNVVPSTPKCIILQAASFPPKLATASTRLSPVKATSVNYNSVTSVFPAEACETVGGEACLADIYPEVKLPPQEGRNNKDQNAAENVEREYLEYNDAKTVFRAEACDDLGGTFCEREYQKDVY